MTNKKCNDTKIFEMYSQLKVKCDCGHAQVIPAYRDSWNCSYCGKKLNNNTKVHFMYKLRKELSKNEEKNKRR